MIKGRGNGGRLHAGHLDGRKPPADDDESPKDVSPRDSPRRPQSSLPARLPLHVFLQQTNRSRSDLGGSDLGVAQPGVKMVIKRMYLGSGF